MSAWPTELSLNECGDAIRSMREDSCWFAYRLPGKSKATFSTGYIVSGIHRGFVIAPFHIKGNENDILTIIPDQAQQPFSQAGLRFPLPGHSTTQTEHSAEVEAIVKAIDGDMKKKVVAARVLNVDLQYASADVFTSLCLKYPEAFVFTYNTEKTGQFFGASPELLLRCENGHMNTMALAGTRPAVSPDPWDMKNIEEQRIVVDYILGIFESHGIRCDVCGPFTRDAGPVEHICSIVKTHDNVSFRNPEALTEFLTCFSPTPALSGMPRDFAEYMIGCNEHFLRGYYGGFCGPLFSLDNFEFYVTLRCGCRSKGITTLYAGGGITALSTPDGEWKETEIKLSTMLDVIRSCCL